MQNRALALTFSQTSFNPKGSVRAEPLVRNYRTPTEFIMPGHVPLVQRSGLTAEFKPEWNPGVKPGFVCAMLAGFLKELGG